MAFGFSLAYDLGHLPEVCVIVSEPQYKPSYGIHRVWRPPVGHGDIQVR